jgi:hypothetical protein
MICLFYCTSLSAQQLSQVHLAGGKNLAFISFITDQKINIRISDQGQLLEWGMEQERGRYNYDLTRLQPYMGRVDYFGPETDSAFQGKVKSIGTTWFTYYNSFEPDFKKGKIKTIGNLPLDYFTQYENKALQGKLKSAGFTLFDYYSDYENEAYRGKLKKVGSDQITYHSSFDEKYIEGKVKNIGIHNFEWGTSFDQKGMQGALKNGNTARLINGIVYIVR